MLEQSPHGFSSFMSSCNQLDRSLPSMACAKPSMGRKDPSPCFHRTFGTTIASDHTALSVCSERATIALASLGLGNGTCRAQLKVYQLDTYRDGGRNIK